MTHLFGRLFRTTRWSNVKKPHRQFDAVFHALSEYGLKTKEKDVLCHQNREMPLEKACNYKLEEMQNFSGFFSFIYIWFDRA